MNDVASKPVDLSSPPIALETMPLSTKEKFGLFLAALTSAVALGTGIWLIAATVTVIGGSILTVVGISGGASTGFGYVLFSRRIKPLPPNNGTTDKVVVTAAVVLPAPLQLNSEVRIKEGDATPVKESATRSQPVHTPHTPAASTAAPKSSVTNSRHEEQAKDEWSEADMKTRFSAAAEGGFRTLADEFDMALPVDDTAFPSVFGGGGFVSAAALGGGGNRWDARDAVDALIAHTRVHALRHGRREVNAANEKNRKTAPEAGIKEDWEAHNVAVIHLKGNQNVIDIELEVLQNIIGSPDKDASRQRQRKAEKVRQIRELFTKRIELLTAEITRCKRMIEHYTFLTIDPEPKLKLVKTPEIREMLHLKSNLERTLKDREDQLEKARNERTSLSM